MVKTYQKAAALLLALALRDIPKESVCEAPKPGPHFSVFQCLGISFPYMSSHNHKTGRSESISDLPVFLF